MAYQHAASSPWKAQADDSTQMIGATTPQYKENGFRNSGAPWYNVASWSKKKIGLVAAAIVVILVIVIVVPIETTKNKYPDYSALTYNLNSTFSGTSFFDNFDYFTGYDPTAGFVHYMLPEQAKPYNLTYAGADTAVVRVDNTVSDPNAHGRYSVRLTSKLAWDTGLFIFDVHHTPYGCSLWPALWTTNANLASWPASGEIDIMESVNNASSGNQMTLHTTDGCKMDVRRKETGTILDTDCYNGTNANAGCGVQGVPSSFGSAFNANGGGIMAMELRTAGIRMWQFARNAIPSDITTQKPDPSTWGTALADFPGTDCDIGTHFNNQSIVIDIDVCGTWAGAANVYNTQDGCPGLCTDYATQNPSAFDEAYFEFGDFWIYQAS
ncbi:MAG: hypothetical protein M1818_002336 [Claussenomyces sp. TS43310]|nr:MAG: hypothetical protein M1818_002336 [Claussenomyces sp. TS43310]